MENVETLEFDTCIYVLIYDMILWVNMLLWQLASGTGDVVFCKVHITGLKKQ